MQKKTKEEARMKGEPIGSHSAVDGLVSQLVEKAKEIIVESDLRHVDRTVYVLCKLFNKCLMGKQEHELYTFYEKEVG